VLLSFDNFLIVIPEGQRNMLIEIVPKTFEEAIDQEERWLLDVGGRLADAEIENSSAFTSALLSGALNHHLGRCVLITKGVLHRFSYASCQATFEDSGFRDEGTRLFHVPAEIGDIVQKSDAGFTGVVLGLWRHAVATFTLWFPSRRWRIWVMPTVSGRMLSAWRTTRSRMFGL
jgi:hypothetical protein